MQAHTQNGRLTAYGLSCGYIDVFQPGGPVWVTLWRECGMYHVRVVDDEARGNETNGVLAWEARRTLTAAHKLVKDYLKNYARKELRT